MVMSKSLGCVLATNANMRAKSDFHRGEIVIDLAKSAYETVQFAPVKSLQAIIPRSTVVDSRVFDSSKGD